MHIKVSFLVRGQTFLDGCWQNDLLVQPPVLLPHQAEPAQQPLLVGLGVLAAAGGRVFHRGGARGHPLLHDQVWQQESEASRHAGRARERRRQEDGKTLTVLLQEAQGVFVTALTHLSQHLPTR